MLQERLESIFKPDASWIVEDFEQGRDIILDQVPIPLFSVLIQDQHTTL